jgi:hypothetical protein
VTTLLLRPRPGTRPEPARGGEDGVLSQYQPVDWECAQAPHGEP